MPIACIIQRGSTEGRSFASPNPTPTADNPLRSQAEKVRSFAKRVRSWAQFVRLSERESTAMPFFEVLFFKEV